MRDPFEQVVSAIRPVQAAATVRSSLTQLDACRDVKGTHVHQDTSKLRVRFEAGVLSAAS